MNRLLLLLQAGSFELLRPLPWAVVTLAAGVVILVPVPGVVAVFCNVALAFLVGAGWFGVVLGLPAEEPGATLDDRVRR